MSISLSLAIRLRAFVYLVSQGFIYLLYIYIYIPLHLLNVFFNCASSVIPPWSNLWLLGSIILTMILHVLVLYVRPLSVLFSVSHNLFILSTFLCSLLKKSNSVFSCNIFVFQVMPLSWAEWTMVFYLSFPVSCFSFRVLCAEWLTVFEKKN